MPRLCGCLKIITCCGEYMAAMQQFHRGMIGGCAYHLSVVTGSAMEWRYFSWSGDRLIQPHRISSSSSWRCTRAISCDIIHACRWEGETRKQHLATSVHLFLRKILPVRRSFSRTMNAAVASLRKFRHHCKSYKVIAWLKLLAHAGKRPQTSFC